MLEPTPKQTQELDRIIALQSHLKAVADVNYDSWVNGLTEQEWWAVRLWGRLQMAQPTFLLNDDSEGVEIL